MSRNPQVLVQIGKIDEMLAESGVRSYCIDCFNSAEGGCCQRCPNQGTDGCTNKPLACALWLCHRAKQEFPAVAAKFWNIAMEYPVQVAFDFRHKSLEAEELWTQHPESFKSPAQYASEGILVAA